MRRFLTLPIVILLAAGAAWPQAAPRKLVVPPGFAPPMMSEPTAAPTPTPAPAPAEAPKATQPVKAADGSVTNVLNLHNAPLTALLDILAQQLKINYILDPAVKGSVMINTYGEVKPVAVRPLLESILRINGFAMVQVGDIYRIVPAKQVARLPIRPQVNMKTFPDDEQILLNLVFLKYATAADLSKVLEPFIGEGAVMVTHDSGNLLIIQDNSRNMRRIMELIALLDSDILAEQRTRLFEIKNSRPTDIVKELDRLFKAISMGSDKNAPIKFIAIDRINAVLAVAPNPGVFEQVQSWINKLDIVPPVAAGAVENHVYRVRYGRAQCLAMIITALYGGSGASGSYGMGMMAGCSGGSGVTGLGLGGSGTSSYSTSGSGTTGLGTSVFGTSSSGTSNYGTSSYQGYSVAPGSYTSSPASMTTFPGTSGTTGSAAGGDQTGGYLSAGAGTGASVRVPRVIPNMMDNSLLIQATQQEYDQLLKLLKELDVAPRQVLIEAKIYEVQLTGAFSSGISVYLQANGTSTTPHQFMSSLSDGTLGLSAGMLVGKSRELMGIMSLAESEGKTKVISSPNLIATDNIAATLNVGDEVPTLSSTGVSSATSSGSSLFTSTVTYRTSGITLNVLPQVNPSGVVTLLIAQDISTPVAASSTSAIQSSSFQHRTFTTQVTLQDGDTIAIAGVIKESDTVSTSGIPVLHKIPVLGSLFGTKSVSKDRTEMVVFLTPHVIYDTNGLLDASEELRSKLRAVTRMMKD